MSKIDLGAKGENIVTKYLENNNFVIIDKNYRTRFGEIDIIAQKDNLIAFVEVKLRNNPKFSLTNLVPFSKQLKIIKTALNYLSANSVKLYDKILRFDVALLEIDNDKTTINYIENAFTKPEQVN